MLTHGRYVAHTGILFQHLHASNGKDIFDAQMTSGNWTIIGWDNAVSPVRCRAIT